jgi:CcmD family protein
MKQLIKIIPLCLFLLLSANLFAQDGMEEYFYESGKIKVVVAVVAIVLIGLFVYIFSLEKRLKKIEGKR